MKNIVLGIVAGVLVTIVCVLGMHYLGPRDAVSPPAADSGAAAPQEEPYETGPSPSPSSEFGLVDEDGMPLDPAALLEAELLAARERAIAEEKSGAAPGEPVAKTDTLSAIQKLAQYHESRTSDNRRELRKSIEEIRKKGRETVPDLLNMLNGDGSDTTKIIAAGVLGSINAGLQDPDLTSTLNEQVIPMLEAVARGNGDGSLKREAISSLGEMRNDAAAAVLGELLDAADRRNTWAVINALGTVGTESAHGILADIMTGERDQWAKMSASRTLGKNGSIDSAYQVLPALRNPGNDSEFILAATTIAQINARVGDADLTTQLTNAVPHLKGVLDGEGGNRTNAWMALTALSAIGNDDANQALVDIVKGEKGNDGLRQSAVYAMSQYGKPEAAAGLSEALQAAQDDERRIDIAMAIASIANNHPESPARQVASSRAIPLLHQLASAGGTALVQKRALRAMGRVGSIEDIEAIKQIGIANRTLQSSVDDAVRMIEQRTEEGPDYESIWYRAW